jgi:nucleolar protein 6
MPQFPSYTPRSRTNIPHSAGGAELVPSKNENPIMVAKNDKSHDEPAPSAVKKVEAELSDRQKKKAARRETKLQTKDAEASEAPAEKEEKVEKKEKKVEKKEKKVEKKEKKVEKKEEEKATEPELFGMNPARLAMMSKPEQPTFPTHRRRY